MNQLIKWPLINTVLLDMDGTLLDLHYDNHFWLNHLPNRYAEKHGHDPALTQLNLVERFDATRGTIQWYCLDHWSRELDIDIVELKQEVAHLIAIHPHVLDFLAAVRGTGRRAVLVTNAHQKSLAMKLHHTELEGHLDAVVCAHDLKLPKEEPAFWDALQTVEPFDPATTVLIDDNLDVLRSARQHGIAQCLAVRQPDSQQPPKDTAEFAALTSFLEIMPYPSS